MTEKQVRQTLISVAKNGTKGSSKNINERVIIQATNFLAREFKKELDKAKKNIVKEQAARNKKRVIEVEKRIQRKIQKMFDNADLYWKKKCKENRNNNCRECQVCPIIQFVEKPKRKGE